MKTDSSWLSKIPKKPLSKVVVDEIKKAIINGTLKPGDMLPSETVLASKIGVGKSSIREAIKMLEAIGVVEIDKGNGSRIRNKVGDDLFNPLIFELLLESHKSRGQLLEFRIFIEEGASLLAIDNATEEDIAKLKEIVNDTKKKFNKAESTIGLDMEFHQVVYASTHNPYMVIVGKAVMELFQPSLVISNEQHGAYVVKDHKNILKALVDRDKTEMSKMVRLSLNRWYKYSLDNKK